MADAKVLAAALAAARRAGKLACGDPVPDGMLPTTFDEAYRAQEIAVALMKEPIAGYKIGGTSVAIQKEMKLDGPFRGAMLAPRCHKDGAVVPAPEGLLGVETEFAFRLSRDLPPRERPYGRDDVVAVVETMHPAFEIVGQRLPWSQFTNAKASVADFALNVAFVYGVAAPQSWRTSDLAAAEVRLLVGGKEEKRGTGAAVLGNPLNVLAWIAEFQRTRDGLKAGQWISTGTCTGWTRIPVGVEAVAEFGPWGRVGVTFMRP
ncbi:MAG: hypothetical protein JNK11_13910 [Alphaproteobacteria bacterium]|nr:hypothetical protein [Alphaproteobacteria bacterium]